MKNVLVTGAAGGMGKAICELLSSKGYNVFGMDYCQVEEPGNMKFYRCDVTKTEEIEAVFEKVKEEAESLFAIIHTAGVYDLDSLLEMDEQRFVRIFNINLFGVYRVNKVFKPLLNRGGRIVITSSELAPLDPLPFTGIYAITKAALEKYAFSLRMETNLLGISVSVIRPGAVKTGLLNVSTTALERFMENTKLYNTNAKKFRQIVDGVETKNIEPEDIAQTALRALTEKTPKYVYKINRNPLLLLLNSLPQHLQVFAIEQVIKDRTKNK
ncbi:MAG: SDR family NAD(P)-dependent oxidoreductase [Clostridia bacterium]|nr:SDR family NAD(P)-dependent oxidoreductase [Clostridia bacterium]